MTDPVTTDALQTGTGQCPAVNDGMEGVRCHGDAGHQELHWADVSGDGDVTEWGDNDELWDELDRLRSVIENAPHDYYCSLYFVDQDGVQEDDPNGYCDCWKADAL